MEEKSLFILHHSVKKTRVVGHCIASLEIVGQQKRQKMKDGTNHPTTYMLCTYVSTYNKEEEEACVASLCDTVVTRAHTLVNTRTTGRVHYFFCQYFCHILLSFSCGMSQLFQDPRGAYRYWMSSRVNGQRNARRSTPPRASCRYRTYAWLNNFCSRIFSDQKEKKFTCNQTLTYEKKIHGNYLIMNQM